MRRQYHFRQSDAGLLAWDVHRLIALSRELPVSHVPLSSIAELDEAYWWDAGSPPPTCRQVIDQMQLVEAADLQYPIILCPQGRMMDGMHRVAKALLQGKQEIAAVRLLELPSPDHIGVDPDDLCYDDV
ncbi:MULTISPECIES: hypothetical protein [Stenotrophomonas]|uniref:hypothetical protein n=1 Tax=Stenotrophomonas TaxID=40323 RepID=UPI0007705282|nr:MULTISPECIES: hypothetical protein [Stenotrophomonas]AMJ58281.1 hypothetical protein AXG53_17825 [Stenotrophomonas sp. KCTC 12332]